MTVDEAIEIIRRKWPDNDGCRSCGWKSALYEFEPLEHRIDAEDLMQGYVDLPCHSDYGDDESSHRGARVYFRDPDQSSAGDKP